MFQRILVPLDGSAHAERALPLAARIARASRGSVTLLHVVTHPIEAAAYFMQPPDETEHTLNARHTKAADYLTALARSDAFAGVVTAPEVADSMPAQTILSVARLQSVDLIVMTSHGARGFQHWALGSVAQKVARHLLEQNLSGVPVKQH